MRTSCRRHTTFHKTQRCVGATTVFTQRADFFQDSGLFVLVSVRNWNSTHLQSWQTCASSVVRRLIRGISDPSDNRCCSATFLSIQNVLGQWFCQLKCNYSVLLIHLSPKKKKNTSGQSHPPPPPLPPPRNPAEKQAIDFITKQWITFFKFVCFWLNELLGWTSLHTADLRYASVWLCFMKTLVMLIIILIVVVIILYDKQFFASALTLVVIFFLFGNYRHNWCVLEVLFSVLDPYIYTRRQGNLSLSLSFYLSISMTLSLSVCRLNVTHSDFQNATWLFL